ncbi:MAG: hypothetical protein MK106_15080 [Mariniblastus sp.]|nr:hypothetical protein [Mariniblastus sp.]
MIRSILMALGIFLLILGGESLLVDKVVVTSSRNVARVKASEKLPQSPIQKAGFQSQNYYQEDAKQEAALKRSYQTREWMPWSLLAAGVITVLYSYSLSKS